MARKITKQQRPVERIDAALERAYARLAAAQARENLEAEGVAARALYRLRKERDRTVRGAT